METGGETPTLQNGDRWRDNYPVEVWRQVEKHLPCRMETGGETTTLLKDGDRERHLPCCRMETGGETTTLLSDGDRWRDTYPAVEWIQVERQLPC